MIKITEIDMPAGYRYMSQHKNYLLNGGLPLNEKFILNKSIPGCGGTSMFLESDLPLVLISPRVQVLKEKHKQNIEERQRENTIIETFLFQSSYKSSKKREEDICNMMSELNWYIKNCMSSNPFVVKKVPKILVTLDSAEKVLDVIKGLNMLDEFLYVVDEFQCLMGDANFKGSTDMNFLTQINSMVNRICYLSATPIPDWYLDEIPEFCGLSYFKLNWDSSVLEEPTVRELQMKKGESTDKICESIIADYRANGYFGRKINLETGEIVYSKEVCIFLNEVKKIKDIILKNNISPDEVTILCAESSASELPKGYSIGGLSTDKNNPINKPFTFCTKASFEGVDFYSDNAITYIFIDGNKPWQTLDIFLDIPQILGRQRLDKNPFKHDATIYYKVKPSVETEQEFRAKQYEMLMQTDLIINEFNSATENMQKILIKNVAEKSPDKKFKDDYIDIIRDINTNSLTIGINNLVKVARMNDWVQRSHFYNHPFQLMTSIQSAITTKQKPLELKEFEKCYYTAVASRKLELYSTFRHSYPQYREWLFANPFVAFEYHAWYDSLGFDKIEACKFNEEAVERAYNEGLLLQPIINECRNVFQVGVLYKKDDVKNTLQKIYDSLGLVGKRAKAVELPMYLNVEEAWYSEGGKRNKGYRIC